MHASLGNRSTAEKRNGEWMSCKKVFPIDNRDILGMEDPPPPDVPFFTKDGHTKTLTMVDRYDHVLCNGGARYGSIPIKTESKVFVSFLKMFNS